MTIGDGLVTYRADNVIDYGQYNHAITVGGYTCGNCGTWVGSWQHNCYSRNLYTYVPIVITPQPDVAELLDEVKKLRKELKRARKGDA